MAQAIEWNREDIAPCVAWANVWFRLAGEARKLGDDAMSDRFWKVGDEILERLEAHFCAGDHWIMRP